MKCSQCTSEIDLKWSHAINQNICPFCGKEIMNPDLQELVRIFTMAMEEFVATYPDHLSECMKRFGFISIEEAAKMVPLKTAHYDKDKSTQKQEDFEPGVKQPLREGQVVKTGFKVDPSIQKLIDKTSKMTDKLNDPDGFHPMEDEDEEEETLAPKKRTKQNATVAQMIANAGNIDIEPVTPSLYPPLMNNSEDNQLGPPSLTNLPPDQVNQKDLAKLARLQQKMEHDKSSGKKISFKRAK